MVKLLRNTALLIAICWTAPALAQNPSPTPGDDSLSAASSQTWTTPSYQQPEITSKDLHHARVVAKANQRQNRIAARKWFGFSNLRPTVSPTPWAAGYSPTWVSNTAQPFMWAGVGGMYW